VITEDISARGTFQQQSLRSGVFGKSERGKPESK
jgi:hypothetical protein